MIEIKTALKRDFSMIEEFFKENQLNLKNEFNHSSNYVIVLEEKKILGISEILYKNCKTPIIEMLFVISRERNKGLGDGLLRATLNCLLTEGHELVLLKKDNELNSFYLHENLKDFEELVKEKEFNAVIMKEDNPSLKELNFEKYFYCKPEIFFIKGCKS
ncbi:MAG: GNAT family N-acetyltransferase [Clostridiales bacterium]|nr:GNAT family N-acetyltransferase [Clostridiales bacterium]